MIVVYRGLHCPVCETYLGKLQTVASDFVAKGVDLVAYETHYDVCLTAFCCTA